MPDQEDTFSDLRAPLTEALHQALTSYLAFRATPAPLDDAKAFTAHHNACKSALLHMALLLKLSLALDRPRQETTITDWLDLARQALENEDTDDTNITSPDTPLVFE